MPLAAGVQLGPYEVVAPLGAGGMGEVYRARDIRLDRTVAIKILPPELASDPERRARFEREAKSISALSHPNICALYDVGEAAGIAYLVMEFLSGQTLADRLSRGSVGPPEAIAIAVQVADALTSAHDQRIVHRDLKPANVMLTDAGHVKVLDFGLAKVQSAVATGLTASALTSDGHVLGTLPYMSPEQLRGEPVDARTDIYAFGTMLHEMLAGRRPFCGESAVELVSAILRDEPPPLSQLARTTPARLARLVQRCLEKEPRRRVQSAADLRSELQDIQDEMRGADSGRSVAAEPATSWIHHRPAQILAAVATLAIVIASVVWMQRWSRTPAPVGPPSAKAIAVLPFENVTKDTAQDYFVDGMHDALITELAKLGSVRVTSRNAVLRYREGSEPLENVARELGVDTLITGSVLRSGNRVRIHAELVPAGSQTAAWANNYDRDIQDILSLLNDVSRSITSEIQTRLGGPAPVARAAVALPKVQPEAYDTYLRGRQVMQASESAAGIREARTLFRQAVAIDPQLSPAWSGVANAALALGVFLAREPGAITEAREAATRALDIDQADGSAWGVSGMIDLYVDWKFDAAKPKLERAVALGPYQATARHGLADYLMVTGDFEGSLEQVVAARASNPGSTLLQSMVLFHMIAARHYDQVIADGRRALQIHPNMVMLHGLVGNALWRQGKYEAALPEIKASFGPDTEGWVAFESAFTTAGPAAARKVSAAQMAARPGADPLAVAADYADAGERDLAFTWLEQAYRARLPRLLHIVADPAFDGIRGDARYKDLIRRIGVPRTAY